MDLSDDDFERPDGRKNRMDGYVSDSGSENRTTKKRKKARKNTKDAKAKQNIGFKCSPHLLVDLVRNLDTDQRKWVEEIGFAVFLSMPNCGLPKDLTVWLVNQCSWKDKALIVRGRPIKIKTLIKKLLGIPDGPYAVPLPRSKRGKAKGSTDEDKELKEEKGARCLSSKSTLESLVATHDPEQFKRSFMLYVLCIYLAPSSGHYVNLSYSPIVNNVEIIKDMNWCDHVADVLIEGIREYRESKAANVNVHGCVHVLILIYIDVVKSDILKVPHGDPRAIYVTTDMLDLLDLTDFKCRTADGPVYGKLEMDESTYADECNHGNTATSSSHDVGAKNASDPCSHSLPVIHVDKVFLDGIMEIDAQFVKARDEVYAESFKSLSEMIMKIDSERASAIRSLHEKLYSTQADSSSIAQSSIPVTTVPDIVHPTYVAGSIVDAQAHALQKSQDPHATFRVCSTPYTQPSFLNSPSQAHLIDSTRVQFPVELSVQADPPNRVDNTHAAIQSTEISPDRGHTTEEGNQCCPGSIDGRQCSVDLQNNCLQLSTIVVSTAETERIIKSSRWVQTRRLFPEESVVNMQVPIIDDPLEDDPLGNAGIMICSFHLST